MLNLEYKTKQEIKCPICEITRCKKHCNTCGGIIGKDVFWGRKEGKPRLVDRGNVQHKCIKGRYVKNGLVNVCSLCNKETSPNHDCHFESIVIHEDDFPDTVRLKKQIQDHNRDRTGIPPMTPELIKKHQEWLKTTTAYTFGAQT